ncbi:MAG: PaaI family thioesterase [Sulfitobacter sp.]
MTSRTEAKTLPPHTATGSGAQSLVGYRIDLTDPAGSTIVRLDVEAKHLNRNGTLQGGIHAMLLDAAAGFSASRALGGQGDIVPVVTLTLTTHFLAPVAAGEVVATGHVTGGGRKIIYADAEVRGPDGTLLSRASGVFKRTVL